MEKQDIKSRADIFLLVSTFYDKVRQDVVLGPIFNTTIKDWDAHLDQLTTFWESSLFLKTKYLGNPLEAHVRVDKAFNHSIGAKHFGLWLNLWFSTIDALFEGERAEQAKRRAQKMSTFMQIHIFKSRN